MLVVKQAGLDGRGARTQNLNRRIHGSPMALAFSVGITTTAAAPLALLLEAVTRRYCVTRGLYILFEVLIGGIEPSCLRILLDRGLVPGKGIQDGTAAKALGKAVQRVIDLIGGRSYCIEYSLIQLSNDTPKAPSSGRPYARS